MGLAFHDIKGLTSWVFKLPTGQCDHTDYSQGDDQRRPLRAPVVGVVLSRHEMRQREKISTI
jgi:hypothetical protein